MTPDEETPGAPEAAAPSGALPPAPGPDTPVQEDVYGRTEESFPRLTDEQIARIEPFGKLRTLADGELLWEQGHTDIPFFVVLEGKIAVLAGPNEDVVAAHGPGEFTGDVDMLSGRGSVVHGTARGETRVIELERNRLHDLVQTDAELSEILLRAFILRRLALVAVGHGDVILIGSCHSAETLKLQEFLTRNSHPYMFVNADSDTVVQELLDRFKVKVDDVPIVICRTDCVLRKPSIEQVAETLGLNSAVESDQVHDLIIVGAGPAGLAAAVCASSEGLDVLVLEAKAAGGQAGSSSKIENYLGFPTGITGHDLATSAVVQAEKFGAQMAVAIPAVKLRCERRPYVIELTPDNTVRARTVILATGAEYRRLKITDLHRFEGAGVYYGATPLEAHVCANDEILVIGGGNSAGQAAVFLARTAKKVDVLIRGPGLAESMSRYLIRRIEETPNIELLTHTEVEAFEGEDHLERVTFRNTERNETETRDIRHVFMMTGATPNTKWLEGCLALDAQGFIRTGNELTAADLEKARWRLERRPSLFETSLPGVFAVGDVRSRSAKRVAAAVGEGTVCVQLIHQILNG